MNTAHQRIEDFFTTFPSKNIACGDILSRSGESLANIHYIHSGSIEQYDVSEQGNKLVVNTHGPGSFVSMTAVFNIVDNAWFYEACEDSVVYVAPIEDVRKFIKTTPEALYSFTQRLCSGATGQQRRMVHLMGGNASNRLLYELLVMFRRHGKNDNELITINCTDTKLAHASGLSRETVNREILKLKKQGYIDRQYKKISTTSIKKLEQKLGFHI